MLIKSVQLDSFRNLSRQKIEFCDGLNILVGDNGQGKTNLLEAIHLLATLRSFRSVSLSEMICHDRDNSELSAQLIADDVPLSLRLGLTPSGRNIWVGQKRVSSVADYLGRMNVVAFTPDDLAMIKGGPSLRRRFMDRSSFLFRAEQLQAVREFKSALKSRNHLLRHGGPDDQLESFTLALARFGCKVSLNRRSLIRSLEQILSRNISFLSGDRLSGSLVFSPGWDVPDDPEQAEESLAQQLLSNLERDKRRGSTCSGPQLDDFDVSLAGRSARKFGSQGQQRAVAVALMLSVVSELVAAGGEQAIILLDDVSSELDAGYRSNLFNIIYELGGQVMVTTTDRELLGELPYDEAKLFEVSQGLVNSTGG